MAEATKTKERTSKTKPSDTQLVNNPAREFRMQATERAKSILREWVGEEKMNEAAGRIAVALSAAAASARDPKDFYACTPASIAHCVAVAALTNIMPGTGSTALAYVIPQRPRKNEAPQLQFSLSHRGLNALARRSGQQMIAVPIGVNDELEFTNLGEPIVKRVDVDNPPETFEDLRGVIVVVRELGSAVVSAQQFVARKLIEKRRAISRSFTGSNPEYSPWSTWPIEMSMKTAMHYAVSRGWCVIDDADSNRVIAADGTDDVMPRTEQRLARATAPSLEQLREKFQPAEPAYLKDLEQELSDVEDEAQFAVIAMERDELCQTDEEKTDLETIIHNAMQMFKKETVDALA